MLPRSATRLLLTALVLCCAVTAVSTAWSSAAAQDSGELLTMEEAKKLKSPVPYTKESIARGKILYTRKCTECHGPDGKSLVDVVANATDLTDPKAYVSGASEGEVYRSIRDGAGEAMPPFADEVSKDADLWDMVNFLRSLWPDSARPKLQEDKTDS